MSMIKVYFKKLTFVSTQADSYGNFISCLRERVYLHWDIIVLYCQVIVAFKSSDIQVCSRSQKSSDIQVCSRSQSSIHMGTPFFC